MNNKGSTIVEATVAFPIVILSLVAIITILIFMYTEATKVSNAHMELVAFAGKDTKTMITNIDTTSGKITEGIANFSKSYYYGDEIKKKEFGLIKGNAIKNLEERLYKINEKDFIRAVDFVTGN